MRAVTRKLFSSFLAVSAAFSRGNSRKELKK